MEESEYLNIVQIFNEAFENIQGAEFMLIAIEANPDYEYRDKGELTRVKEILGLEGEYVTTALELIKLIDPDGHVINQENFDRSLIRNSFHQDLMNPDSAIHSLIRGADRTNEINIKLSRVRQLGLEANDRIYKI